MSVSAFGGDIRGPVDLDGVFAARALSAPVDLSGATPVDPSQVRAIEGAVHEMRGIDRDMKAGGGPGLVADGRGTNSDNFWADLALDAATGGLSPALQLISNAQTVFGAAKSDAGFTVQHYDDEGSVTPIGSADFDLTTLAHQSLATGGKTGSFARGFDFAADGESFNHPPPRLTMAYLDAEQKLAGLHRLEETGFRPTEAVVQEGQQQASQSGSVNAWWETNTTPNRVYLNMPTLSV